MKGLKHVVFAAGLALSAGTSAAILTSHQPGTHPFASGDVLLWGAHDGGQCIGLCIRTERHGNSIMTYVYGSNGELFVADTFDLSDDKGIRNRQPIPLSVYVSEDDQTAGSPAPPPPVGGTGSVSQTQSWTSGGTVWIRTTTFYFINGNLVDIKVEIRQFNVER